MRKTIKAKISGATNGSKLDILDRELQRWDDILGDLKKMRHHDYPISEKQSEYNLVKTGKRPSAYCAYATFMIDSLDHPLPLHNDRFNVERRDTEVAAYWISVPTLERHGGVWLPLELPYQYYGFEDEWDIGDSYITKQDGKYYVHLKIEKEVDTRDEYDGVLGIDLGVRHVAVTWNTVKEKPRFYGRDLREIRGKYHYLRRKLQRQGDDGAVENLGKREKGLV